MWAASFNHFADLASSLSDKPEWSLLARFLALRSKGLRPEALNAIREFADLASGWELEERIALVKWLDAHNRSFVADIIPHPLMKEVMAPTITEWLQDRPGSADANYLFAIHIAIASRESDPGHFIELALATDPNHQKALLMKLSWLTDAVEYSQHELPIGYIGSTDEDIVDLKQAIPLAERLSDREVRERVLAELAELLATAQDWIEFKNSEPPDDWTLRSEQWNQIRSR